MVESDRALCEHCGKVLGLEVGREATRVDLSNEKMKLEFGMEWGMKELFGWIVGKGVVGMLWLQNAGGGIWAPRDSSPRFFRALRKQPAGFMVFNT